MDLWITLRDGRTTPLTGVSNIASIDTVGTSTEFTGSSITSGSPYVIVGNTDGIRPGSMVFGSGIPTGATVLSITSGTVFVMSANATATIGSLTITVAAVSTADQKLLTVNSGWYRDIFTGSSDIKNAVLGVGGLVVFGASQTALIYKDPVSMPLSPGAFTATPLATTSDELAHEPLRQATWYEALWAFTCTTDAIVGPTLTLYYRKYDVVGFCNVAPSL